MSILAIGFIIIAYLIGSISISILLCKCNHLPDPRYYGTGCTDLYNVWQLGGRWIVLFVFLGDILKGMLPVWIGYNLGLTHIELGLVAISISIGQVFPVFFHFKGGKGIVTSLGSIAPISWSIAILTFGTWMVVFLLTRYISLSAVLTAILAPFYTWYYRPEFTLPVSMVCCLIVYRYHESIQQLWRGKEKPFYFK